MFIFLMVIIFKSQVNISVVFFPLKELLINLLPACTYYSAIGVVAIA